MLIFDLVTACAMSSLASSVSVNYDKNSMQTSFKAGSTDIVASYTNTTEGWFYLDINAGTASTPEDKVDALKMVIDLLDILFCVSTA